MTRCRVLREHDDHETVDGRCPGRSPVTLTRVLAATWFILALATLYLLIIDGESVVLAVTAWAGGVVTREMWTRLKGGQRVP